MKWFEWAFLAGPAMAWFYLAKFHGSFWKIAPFLNADQKDPVRWPSVRVVVPARDEAPALRQTLPALLSQNYPGKISVVVSDDHSSDGTGGLARSLAAQKPAVPCRVVSAPPLERGWTGKLWSLNAGLEPALESEGEQPDYYLFTDADIFHPPESVAGLVRQAEESSLDMVSLMARLRAQNFWEKLLIPAFVFFFQKLYPFAWVNDPRAKTAGAAGGCILIRASALRRAGGLAAIRSEIIDDCALARRVKGSGGKIWLGLTDSVLSLRDYDSLGDIWNMVARTAFTQLRHSWLLLAGTALGMAWLYLSAPAAMVAGLWNQNLAWVLWGGASFGIMALLYAPTVRFYRVPAGYAFCLPAIALLYTAMTLDSGLRYLRGKGGQWKGRTYAAGLSLR